MRLVQMAAALGCLLSCASTAHAQQAPRMPYQEYADRVKAAELTSQLKSDLFGDSISLYNGSTEFSVVDISLSGNDALPVQLGRRFKVQSVPWDSQPLGGFGGWDLDIPYIAGTFIDNWMSTSNDGRRCSNFGAPQPYYPFEAHELYSGVQLRLPGSGEQEVLRIATLDGPLPRMPMPSDGQSYSLGTRSFDRIRCKSTTANGFVGEGFIVQTASGLKYTLDVGFVRNAGNIEKRIYAVEPGHNTQVLSRNRVYLAASRIEDRFGNWVAYDWSGDKLTGIRSKDGRAITLTWSGSRIVSATAHGRTWNYAYDVGGMTVTLPDSSIWRFEQTGSMTPVYQWTSTEINGPTCGEPDAALPSPVSLKFTHPSGAIGQFDFEFMRHRRSGIPRSACQPVWTWQNHTIYAMAMSNFFDLYSITSKTISGSGISQQHWGYSYEVLPYDLNEYANTPCGDCQREKSVFVSNPDGTLDEHRFGVLWYVNDGRQLGAYRRAADNSIVRSTISTYMSDSAAQGALFPDIYGAATSGDEPTTYLVRPVVATVILQDGNVPGPTYEAPPPLPPGTSASSAPATAFSNVVNSFDQFARPTSVTKSSSPAP